MSYPEEPVLKVELQVKIKGARKDLFELEQQPRRYQEREEREKINRPIGGWLVKGFIEFGNEKDYGKFPKEREIGWK